MTEVKTPQAIEAQDVPHLADVNDEGMVLQWLSPQGKPFQITYRGDKADKAYHLDRLLSEAMSMAVERWESFPKP